jgi:hypothetical protein
MGIERQVKAMRRCVRKESNKVVLRYMHDHWDLVLRSTISLIQTFKFNDRFRLAIKILLGRKKKSGATKRPLKAE